MIPQKKSIIIMTYDEDEYLQRIYEDDFWMEDDQMERERDLREGQQENDPDDLKDVL